MASSLSLRANKSFLDTVTPLHTVCRFAPSPTGRMHAGNIFSALVSWLIARSDNGEVVLRIEDLDRDRSKAEFIDAVQRDFESLGLSWDRGPYYQHDRDYAYERSFKLLSDKGLVYPCFCTRAELHASSAPHYGEKLVYPGTCRSLSQEQIAERLQNRRPAYRLIVQDRRISIDDLIQGSFEQDLASECGDFLIRRSDGAFAYQLAVVVDDAEHGVNCVVRGVDLMNSSPQQRYLQQLLDLPRCKYAHVPLLVAEENRRLSKRDKDASLEAMLKIYGSAEGIIGHIAYVSGIIDHDEACCPEDLIPEFSLERLKHQWQGVIQIQWH